MKCLGQVCFGNGHGDCTGSLNYSRIPSRWWDGIWVQLSEGQYQSSEKSLGRSDVPPVFVEEIWYLLSDRSTGETWPTFKGRRHSLPRERRSGVWIRAGIWNIDGKVGQALLTLLCSHLCKTFLMRCNFPVQIVLLSSGLKHDQCNWQVFASWLWSN